MGIISKVHGGDGAANPTARCEGCELGEPDNSVALRPADVQRPPAPVQGSPTKDPKDGCPNVWHIVLRPSKSAYPPVNFIIREAPQPPAGPPVKFVIRESPPPPPGPPVQLDVERINKTFSKKTTSPLKGGRK